MPLDVATIGQHLAGFSIGDEVLYSPEVDSTNRLLASLPERSRRHGLVALTDYQSAGRGRGERRWVAPRGSSVLLSVLLLRPPGARLPDLVSVAALAAGEAVEDVTVLPCDIKWPNDLLIRGRKVCGILAEGGAWAGGQLAIVGLGINVNVGQDALAAYAPDATSLRIETGHEVARETLVVTLVTRLNLWYRNLTDDPDAVFAAWKGKLGTLGQSVLVEDAAGTWQGVAVDVLRDGGLVVRDGDGKERTVYAADISMRPAPGFTSRL